ncbi:hypothetical protein SCUCBS95973_007016 [Sporothrix curviconia]|uniref:Chromatin assembly factor 1 p150 subunit acidic region domain-containing protein n=1 Tax=Sporothrix curviconia TaxID=1260050 RepID=A0ABP0CC62_9PEZI
MSRTPEEVRREIEELRRLLNEKEKENDELRRQKEEERRQKEEERRQKEEERRQKEEERRQKDEERRQKEEERRQKEELQQLQNPTALLTYLSLVDEHLFRSLAVESDPNKTSAPGTTDVSGRCYPQRFVPWTDFDTLHASLFEQLETTLGSDEVFPSRNAMQALGEDSSPLMSDEMDLRPFLRSAVEKPAASIVTQYLAKTRHATLSRFKFRNSSYGMDLRGLGADVAEATGDGGRPKKKRIPSPVKTIGKPDRWGFATHRSGQEIDTHVLVGEYKAAHKLRATKLEAVLAQSPATNFFAAAAREDEQTNQDDLEAAAATTTTTNTQTTTRNGRIFVARVLCQAYHYMISSGLEYGYVASGEALVFLRVPENDANTLYYFWRAFASPARGAVSRPASVPTRPPQNTAAAYLASLALLGLQSSKRPKAWIDERESDLPRKRGRSPDANAEGGDDVEDETDITDATGHPLLPFCTQACLLGLARRQPLDDACPNVHLHRAARQDGLLQGTQQPGHEDRHPLTADQLRERLEKQAAADDTVRIRSLEAARLYGRCGVLVRVTVAGFGYTMVAKGVMPEYEHVLAHELAIYSQLAGVQGVQGRLVPVCLGIVELPDTFDPGPGHTFLSQMLLLSFAGVDLSHLAAIPYNIDAQHELDRTTRELQMLGLYNEDVRTHNCAWNAEAQRVMHFDFDQAEFIGAKVPAEASPAAVSPAATRSPLQAKRNWNGTVSPQGTQDGSPPTKRRAVETV